MNHINILKRAFNITVNYRALWIFGMLLALTTGGSGGGSFSGGDDGSSSTSGFPDFNWPDQFGEFSPPSPEVINTLIGIAITVGCLILLLTIAGIIFRYVSETALIRMVDAHENTGEKLTIRQGFRLGWSHLAGKLFLMDFGIGLAFITAFLLLLALVALPLSVWLTENTPLHILGTIISVGLILLLVFAAIVVGLAIALIKIFARRAVVLENLGVRASLRRGYAIVKQRLGDVIMMGVIMFGVSLIWGLIIIPVFLAVLVAAALIAGLPALLAGSIAGFFTQGYTPWIIAAIVAAPIFLVAVIIPGALIGGWKEVFSSSTWTLTYREALALEQTKANGEPPANVAGELPASDSAITA